MSRIAGSSLNPGDLVDRYQVEALIGAGGMGEVYRAHDRTLGRLVALKILPVGRLSEDRVRRFTAEAINASRLNHPSIVSVHDTGKARTNGSSVYFLAMELIDGETLSAPRRSRDLCKNLELMAQVADGLAVAHAHGIVHRDLKPDNIIVSRDGYAKILDFGISKLTDPNGPQQDNRSTDPATILGTVSYMSPEQAAGREIDHRSDIFSFGSVLYEVVTGRVPFDGPSPVDTLHNILHSEPPLPDNLPRELSRILRKCLAKDRDQRYHSVKDVALDLREAVSELRKRQLSGRIRKIPRAAAIAAVGLIVITGAWMLERSLVSPPSAPARPAVKMTRLTFSGKVVGGAISPDGNYVVHAVREGESESLWVKQVATGSLFRLTEAKLVYYETIRVSPDGNYVYYESATRRDPNVWNVYQIPLLGGEARQVVSDVDGNFTLSPDGKKIAFVRFHAVERQPKLFIADLESGDERIVLKRRERFFGALSWSPDGQSIAFVSMPERPDGDRLIEQVSVEDGSTRQLIPNSFGWVGAVEWLPDRTGLIVTAADRDEPAQLWYVPYPTGEPKKITSEVVGYVGPTVTRDGRAIVAGRIEASSNIWVVEPGVRSPPRALTTGLANYYGMSGGPVWTRDGGILFTAYGSGTVNLCQMMRSRIAGQASLASIGAFGEGISQLTKGRNIGEIEISPTEPRLVYLSDASGPLEVWISDVDGSNPRQLTRNWRTRFPSFFPDGKSIAYVAIGPYRQFAYKMSLLDGSVQQLTDKPTNNTHVSPDGKWLLCRYRQPEPGKPLWRTALVPLERKEPIRFFEVPRYGGSPKLEWHPGGESFSFVDWKDGVANIWMQSVDGGEPRQVTFFDSGQIYGFGWSADGSQLALAQGNPVSDAVLITNFR